MIKIYHNPRCSKSRQGYEILEKSGKEFKVIKYLEDVPTKNEIKEILHLLKIKPEQLLRKNEVAWKENYKGRVLSDDQIIDAMVKHPKLIERPIVINNNKAVIGRPPEKIMSIL